MKTVGDNVTRIREALIKCDDLTGDTAKVVERLQTAQALAKQLDVS